MRWGKGTVDGSFTLVEPTANGPCPLLAVYTSGHVELRFGVLKTHAAFSPEAVRRGLVERLNAIPGVELPAGAHDERRSMPLAAFIDAEARAALLEILGDVVAGLRAGVASGADELAGSREHSA
jgi:hypothetical protein